MIISQGRFSSDFHNMQCIVGSPEGKHFKNVSNLSHSTTRTVVFYVRKRCGITERQTGPNLLDTKSSHDTTNGFYLKQKIFKKNATNLSSTHVRICVKDATPLEMDLTEPRSFL